MLKQLLQEMKQTTAELTANMNAKFEQITANAEINIAEITDKIDAVSYTHLS